METKRLLIVDDEDDFRQTIAKRLKKRGIVPEEAATGEECLSILEKEPIDVVVLDIKMPGMNGIEVLRHIRKNYPKTEVILLTGHATTHDGVEGIKSGAFEKKDAHDQKIRSAKIKELLRFPGRVFEQEKEEKK